MPRTPDTVRLELIFSADDAAKLDALCEKRGGTSRVSTLRALIREEAARAAARQARRSVRSGAAAVGPVTAIEETEPQ